MATPKLRVLKPFEEVEEKWLEEELDDDSGEGGDEGSGGSTGEPMIDPSIFGFTNYHFLEMIRKEEAKFSRGWVPFTKDPNQKRASGMGDGPPAHPLLSESSQFSGVDPKLSADPVESEPGREMYNELQPNLTPSPAARPTASPTVPIPKPGGM